MLLFGPFKSNFLHFTHFKIDDLCYAYKKKRKYHVDKYKVFEVIIVGYKTYLALSRLVNCWAQLSDLVWNLFIWECDAFVWWLKPDVMRC